MSQFLRFNTACRLTVGPFLDKTDGITPEVAITVTSEKLTFIVDEANVPTLILDVAPTASGGANDMVHITGDDAGYYDLELAAADTNHLGRAKLSLNDVAVHCPVFHEFMIIPQQVYDSIFLGTDLLDANASQVGGTAQTGRDIGASVLLSSGTGTGQVSLSSGAVLLQATQTGVTIPTVTTLTNLPAITSNWLTAAGIAASALNGKGDWNIGKTGYALSSAGVQAIWDALTSALTTAGSIGKKLADWVIGTTQTGDSFTRLGAPAGASVSADIAAVKVDTGGAVTPPTVAQIADEVQTRTIAGVTLVATVTTLTNLPAITANWLTATGIAANAFTSAKFAAGAFDAVWSVAVRILTAATNITGITLHADYNAAKIAASQTSVDDLPAAIRDMAVDGAVTLAQSQQLQNSAAAAKLDGAATTTVHLRDLADTKNRVTATVDANGNRTVVTRNFD